MVLHFFPHFFGHIYDLSEGHLTANHLDHEWRVNWIFFNLEISRVGGVSVLATSSGLNTEPIDSYAFNSDIG